MERDLHQRDRVGVQDFVLLEDFQNEQAFIDNLRKRFRENLIYVCIKKNIYIEKNYCDTKKKKKQLKFGDNSPK